MPDYPLANHSTRGKTGEPSCLVCSDCPPPRNFLFASFFHETGTSIDRIITEIRWGGYIVRFGGQERSHLVKEHEPCSLEDHLLRRPHAVTLTTRPAELMLLGKMKGCTYVLQNNHWASYDLESHDRRDRLRCETTSEDRVDRVFGNRLTIGFRHVSFIAASNVLKGKLNNKREGGLKRWVT